MLVLLHCEVRHTQFQFPGDVHLGIAKATANACYYRSFLGTTQPVALGLCCQLNGSTMLQLSLSRWLHTVRDPGTCDTFLNTYREYVGRVSSTLDVLVCTARLHANITRA